MYSEIRATSSETSRDDGDGARERDSEINYDDTFGSAEKEASLYFTRREERGERC